MLRLLVITGILAAGLSRLPGAPLEERDAATIINSGSTNRAGFRIVVDRAGGGEFTVVPRRLRTADPQPGAIPRTLPPALAEPFYADLAAAKPLASLPAGHCV